MDLCKQQGWRTWLCPVEVGVRGFCSQSVHSLQADDSSRNYWQGETSCYSETQQSS
ncbi:hypothetical protein DPMN_033897 [Dreissena polymorpha]|uniref:Uncharacterized protein n=1 Tax=Dreissena polymorpha TaxID=45954 RepID=A0A9D4RJ86_DREPO|nr:hypothetical protein DPMN_033897 [Dreissena polymorpha]